MSAAVRTLAIGDRSISYAAAAEEEAEAGDCVYPSSDRDSGVGDTEDVCCTVDTERRIIKPDLQAIRQLTNFDEDEEDDQVESDEDEDEISIGGTSDTGSSEERGAGLSFDTREAVLGRGAELGQLGLDGFDCHSLGPASLSVLQLSRTELVHMRHVMVKIELDTRLQAGTRQGDSMLASLETGRVCVVCTRTRFSMFSSGLECSVCRYCVCRQCAAPPRPAPLLSLPASPAPCNPPPATPTSPSLSARLGTLFTKRRSSLGGEAGAGRVAVCRPCSQFVEQMNLMTEEEGPGVRARLPTERSM